ncbi:E3 ubiquitin-protein ligase ZNRF3-like [Phoenix dactylifera]|uniref:E3 ubiquitin-protein ligase ZNRF3-like n=1 Tax=Phoenix dactylifera TaxID=42345 RepID=A0A8B9ANQ5_PHODC|nr:E3 ubiquitin-protein ligase ZNRF3-like [Phoenix dactylifera]XP_038988025.1 E3 ubiquitin-protein ligase ZNRF3-like [Phoenix dactylifera]XP_038988026.1 E3 ubiquitin-protein ligase ZNRF3-like [Phoenix dactylifera]
MALYFGDTTTYVSALLKGRNLGASARPLAPVEVHLHVYEYMDGGQRLACRPEFTDFSMYLGHLVDLRDLRHMIPEILFHTFYNDLDTRRFWEEKLIDYAADVGLIAFNAGVQELELTVEIHIRNLARRLLEVEQEMVELAINASDEEIGRGDFGGTPASEASIRELEVVKYDGVGGEFEDNGCSICLEEFELEMEVTRMPCKHVFHGGCLTQWLEKSHLCPLCRQEIPI